MTAAPPASSQPAPPPLVATLPGCFYTDPVTFAREQERIFEAGWVCAARAADLEGTGSFETVQVGRESVIVVRGSDGAIRAFLNVCRHRGARVCTDESGRVRRNLRCPYHSWTYDLSGALTQAPDLAVLGLADRADRSLHPVAVQEWLGYVWLCLAPEPPPFDEVTDQVVARLGDIAILDGYCLESLAVGRRITYDVAANWKLIVENFMECYHCASIHPELVDVLPEFADGRSAQYYIGHGAEFGDDIDGFTLDGSAGPPRLSGVPHEQDRRYYATTIRPQVFLNLVPDHVIVARMTPVAADRTRVVCDWLFAPEVVAGEAAGQVDLSRSAGLFDAVNRQDFEACERTQPAMSSRAYAVGGVLMPSEHHLAEFQGWVTERVG